MERTIICISRQYGSGGREIGEAVAKKLGIPCYDKCLIQKAAQEAGLSETAVAEYDEKGEDFGIAVSGNPFADTAALGEAFYSEEARVFEAERRVILELAEKGGTLIGINAFTLDGDETAISEAKDVLMKKGASYRNVYFNSDGEAGRFTTNIFAYPTTYVVDRKGNIVGDPIVGAITGKSQMETLKSLIDKAIAADMG